METKRVGVAGAAKVLEVHPFTVRRWEREGRLQALRDYRNYRVFDLAEILRVKEELGKLREASGVEPFRSGGR